MDRPLSAMMPLAGGLLRVAKGEGGGVGDIGADDLVGEDWQENSRNW